MSDNVQLCYLIEKTILFNPELCTLTNRLTQKEFKLKSTASLCLLLLVKKKNQVITQNELLEFAWGDNHREVTFNAIYQAILSLRKALFDSGLEKQIITTIMRKGLIVNEDVCIENIAIPLENPGSGVPPASEDQQAIDIPVDKKSSRPLLSSAERIMLILTILVCIFLFIRYNTNADNNFLNGYISLHPNAQGCHYFMNGDAINNSRHEEIISAYPEICSGAKSIYITAYPEISTASILLCSEPIIDNENNTCTTIFLPRREKL